MELIAKVSQLFDLIAKDKMEIAIREMLKLLGDRKTNIEIKELYRSAMEVSGRYFEIKNISEAGTVNEAFSTLEKNRIRKEIISIVFNFEEVVLKNEGVIPSNEILNGNEKTDVITLNLPRDEFSEQEELQLNKAIKELLKTKKEIRIRVEKGSVKLKIELSEDDAEKLFLLLKSGKLNELGYDDLKFTQLKNPNEKKQNIDDLSSIKKDIKLQLVENFEKAINLLNNKLDPSSNQYEDSILILSRYKRISAFLKKGVIDYATFDMEMTKLENTFIYIINNLSSEDIKQ